MTSALVIGGTGFVGRRAVEELVEHGYDVTAMSRGVHDYTVSPHGGVDHVRGNRSDEDVLADVAGRVEPEIVLDCAAFHPRDVRAATRIFDGVDAYVYVSSGAVYSVQEIPKREDDTPLHDCTDEQATDESMATYPARKAEGDREARAAAERGVAATVVRPTAVYGPHPAQDGAPADASPSWLDADLPINQTLHDYWIDRVDSYDRVVVPGDGTAIWHRAYVEDVASALRVVAEAGEPGEAYNVGDRRVCTLEDVIELIASALGTSIEVLHASERDLDGVGLSPNDFVLYHHAMTEYPHVLDTCKVASLGWEATPVETAMERTVEGFFASDRTGRGHGPDREAEERLLERLA